MKVKNIEIKRLLKEVENQQDYYQKVKTLCEIAGVVVFYSKTKQDTHAELQEIEKQARETIETIIKRYKL